MSTSQGGALRHLVVGVDGSEQSKWALGWARWLAGEDTVIDAVIVWRYPANYALSSVGVEPWRPDVEAAKTLQEAFDEVFGSDRPAHLNVVVREGHPAEGLVDASRSADLLIVGSRGHGGFSGALLGSVSARCAESAASAVLVSRCPPPQG